MGTFDPDLLLTELGRTDGRLCFYPSCGHGLLWAVMQLDAELFVFSDYYARSANDRRRLWQHIQEDFRRNGIPLTTEKSTVGSRVFRSGSKWGFLFFQDNNEVLARLLASGCRISVFVGVNDGCCEGGNYQCVHDEPFLGSLLEATAERFAYFTDHSRLLEDTNQSRRRYHRYFRPFVLHSTGWEFRLRSVLVVPGSSFPRSESFYGENIEHGDLEVYFPSHGIGLPLISLEVGGEFSDGQELFRLAEFRVRQQAGIIAHYYGMRS